MRQQPNPATSAPQTHHGAKPGEQPKYRPDVDGLRAIAVLSVLVYHAFPDLLPGGFVGVDIFFVISGFLISGIILTRIQAGTFTFADFYARRIRRIFPALAAVLVACLLAGWLILFPVDYERLGGHVLAGAAFVSNLVLWRESGYFDTSSELKPLLHLWSLGVEEQFYLIWPVLLVLAARFLHRILWAIVAVALLSFAANLLLVGSHASAAFYLPITRFWELMLGSMLAYAQVFSTPLGCASGPQQPTRSVISGGSWATSRGSDVNPRLGGVPRLVGIAAYVGRHSAHRRRPGGLREPAALPASARLDRAD
ncbi:MAG: acyltransferase [Steroidobacteraceae bacterium]